MQLIQNSVHQCWHYCFFTNFMIWPQVYVECSPGLSMQSWAHHYRTDKSPERDGAASKRAASKSRSRSRRKSRSRRRSRSKQSKSRGKRPGSWKRWWRFFFFSGHGDTSLIKLSRLFCLPKLAWSPSSHRRSRSRRRRRSSSKSRDKKRSSRSGAGLALTWLWGFWILGGLEVQSVKRPPISEAWCRFGTKRPGPKRQGLDIDP